MIIVHLTDFHFKSENFKYESKIENINQILKNKNDDMIILLFGGDLANSGNQLEYLKFREFFDSLTKNIKSWFKGELIYFFVPGNHDLEYKSYEKRSRTEILQLTHEEMSKKYEKELLKIKNYLHLTQDLYTEQSKRTNIIELDSPDKKYIQQFLIEVDKELKLEIVTLNNSLFSFYDKEDKFNDNDKGALKLDTSKIQSISRHGNFTILLMHFPLEYFEDFSKNKLNHKIYEHIDVVFTGHVHEDEIKTVKKK